MRCGRSEQAGDLKASNITLPLEQMTTSVRLTLPTTMVGLGLVWDILIGLNLNQLRVPYKVWLKIGEVYPQ